MSTHPRCWPRVFPHLLSPPLQFLERWKVARPGGEDGNALSLQTGSLQDGEFEDSEAHITRYEPNRVEVEVDAPGDAILLLNDLYYPGWVARVDGEIAPIARANTIMRAVAVPAGNHVVEFRYESAVIRDGGRVSLLSFGLLMVILSGLLVAEYRVYLPHP